MLDDLRFSFRQLWKRRSLAMLAALCLALGIGVNCSIFSYIDAMFLRPIAVPNVGRLARVFVSSEQDAFGELSYPEYLDIRRGCPALAGVAVAQSRGAIFLHDGREDMISVYGTSPDFFEVMGVRPRLGRLYGPAEEREPVVLLGYRAWRKYFGGDPNTVGRAIRLSRGTPLNVTVMGVLPAEFRDLHPGGDRDMWLPPATFIALTSNQRSDYESRRADLFEGFARLQPGASLEQAKAQIETVSARLARAYPETNQHRRLFALSDLEWRLHNFGWNGAAVFAVLLLVLAIACINVANLLLVTLETRRHEFAIRAALGAARWRTVRQLLVECGLLGVLGFLLALPLSYWLMEALPRVLGMDADTVAALRAQFDLRVLAFAIAIGALTVVLFGVVPSVAASRVELTPALKNAPARGAGRFPLRNWLALVQVAASLVTLTATGVLVQNFWNRRYGEIGLERKNILTAWQSSANPLPIDRAGLERLRALPGVRGVSLAFRAPMAPNGGGIALPITLPGHPSFTAGEAPVVTKYNTVEPRYFSLLGIRLLRGRVFDDRDSQGAPPVVVISGSMARRYWPTGDPIGRFLVTKPNGRAWQIVGVVADAPINQIGEIPEPYFYTCWWQNPFEGEHTLLVETEGPAAAFAPTLRAALKQIDLRLGRPEMMTLDDLVNYRTTEHQGIAQLVACLGALGLLLMAVGLYGVLAYGVALRTRELGIRMAIGAEARQVASLVVRQGLWLVAGGIALGVPLALGATFALGSMLYGVAPWHPPAFAGGAVVLLAVALAASWFPARHAARVDPAVVLRYE